MRRLAVIETVWYLAFQDGPADDLEYPTEALAKKALRRLKEKRGVCVRSRSREVEP